MPELIGLELPLSVMLIGLLFIAAIGVIWRTIYIKNWIEYYCNTLHTALPKPTPVSILGTSKNSSIEFTWDKPLWYKNEMDRMCIITAATLTAFNEYYDLFDLKDKVLLYVSTKAIKKMTFHHGLIATCCPSPRWGVEIAITYTDKVLEEEKPKKKCITIEDLWVNEGLEEKYISIPERQIMVCRNV